MIELYKKYCSEKFSEDGVLEEFKINPSENFNFAYDIVDEIARLEPNRRAMQWCNIEGDEKTFTFGDLEKLSNKAANFFLSQGIKKGDCVLLMLKRHYEFWYIILALHKIGAIVVPGTHMLKCHDIVYRVKTANIKAAVVTNESNVPQEIIAAQKECGVLTNLYNVREDKEGFINITKEIEKQSDELKRIETKYKEPMLAYFTSGTTGYPKMVVHDYSYALAHLITAKYWQNIDPDGLHLTVAETGWGKAVWGKLYGQWTLGGGIMVYDFDKFVADDLLNIIEKYKVTTFCAPPTIYRFFIKEGMDGHDLSNLKYATTAGEALNLEIIKQFKEKTSLEIKEAYGQTETTCVLLNMIGKEPRLGSMGKPSPLYNVHLLNEKGEETKDDEVGEICIKPDNENSQIGLFTHYHNDKNLTERMYRGGYYHTGDTATRDKDGYYWYVGRVDDIIKSSGYRIGPFEIESVLMEHPAVLECGVTGVPDEVRGQVVKASIVLTKDYKPTKELEQELKDYVKKNTAPYKYPRVIEFMDELPKTISGKIRRNVLRDDEK